jgi:calcineurin-like phosphoesterase family protein
MNTWFTSDLHFGHNNIIRYTQRPYRDVHDMNEALIANWNNQVAADDHVWVLGDVAMGDINQSLQHIGRLAGTITLVAGNHDRMFTGPDHKQEAWTQRYLDAGFNTVLHGTHTIELGAHTVTVSHFPYEGDSRGDERYSDRRPDDNGQFLLHGHTHGLWRQNGRMIDVGIDAWGGTLVNATTLAELVDNGPANLAPLTWHPHQQ